MGIITRSSRSLVKILVMDFIQATIMNKQVFNGLKVAEFAWVIVGPSTSCYLAEHGATVVKIESHKRLDTLRGTSPFADNKPTVDSSLTFGRHNPNKYSVGIDLQHPNSDD